MEPAGPSTEKLKSIAEPQEEKNDTQGPPTLTRNRSFKSKQLVRSQAIRESQSPPRLPSPLPPHNQSEPNASVVQSNSDPNLNVTAAVAEVKSVSSTPSLKGSDDSFNVTNNVSSKNNNPSSLNENKSDRNASQCRAELDAREGGGVRNKQRGRKGDRGGEGKQGREGKECQRVEIQITSGNWELGSPARNRSPKNRDNHDRHSRTQTQKRWLSTKQSSQDSGWRSLEEESWRKGCVCGACAQDKECLWNKWRICPDCRGRKNEPRCPTKQDSGVVCSDDCSDCSELASPEIVLSSANSEPILATDRRRGKDSDKYPEDSYYTMCRCHERNDNLSNNNNSINSNKNTPALLKHLVQDEMDNKNNELAGPTLVQFIKDTLNKSIKDRISLLRIEKELVSLVHDTGRTQHKFPSMTSYGRMLVHRCAQLFCLQHKLNPMAKEAVIVTKIGTFGGRVPCTPFQKWCSVQFPDASVKIHQDMTQAKSILKRSAHSLDESVSAAARGSASARSKSFEQREEEYERVRRRIFSGDETRGSVEDDFNWLQQSEEIVSSLGNTNNVYGKLLTPDTGGGRQNKLVKVHSLETRTGDSLASSGSPRAAVSKSHSFGGYGSSQTSQGARVLSRQGDLASSSWRLSPSSSGYKTLSLRSTDSVTPSPTGDATPEPESQLERAPLLWAVTVTDVSAVPPGAIIILPQTGMPLTNADGSTYHYDPNRPPILPANAHADNAKTQPQHTDKKDEFPGEKRRGRLEKQNSITAPDNYERSPDTLPENTKMQKCCLECCQPNDGMKGGVATLSGQSNSNTLTKSIPNESDTTIDKAISNVCYQRINEPNADSPTRNASKNGTYTKPHTNYIPYGENTKKNMVHEGQNPELLSQKMDSENLAYYPLGFQDVSGYGETEFERYQGHNISGGTNVIQQSQDLAAYCSGADTQKMDLRQSHYNQDGATCQPLRIQLAGPESYAAQVAEHCRLEQNVVQAYALTHQQLVPVQQPAIVHYAQSTAPQHDKPIEGLQGQPNLVYGAYGTCGVPHYAMMDHPGALTDPGRGLLDHNAGLHPTPPPHHPYPVYHDPTMTAQRYAGLQHRQPALLHHAYQYPSSWTTQWPLIASNPNIANQSCPTPVPKPQTPPGVFVPQPDLSLAYQSNPGLIQYPGLLQYPPVNYAPLIQPHLIHTQPYVYPSVYPQQYIDTRTQIPTPTYGEQTNRNNNSGVRSYESFQSTNSRSFRSNVRSPRCNSRTGSVSGSSRTTPLGGQYTPPSNSGENFQQDERFVTYPVYRTHGNTNAYYCNPNCPATNQSGIDFQRNNESNTYLQHSRNYPKNPNEPNTPNVSSNDIQTDVYSKRRAFRSNASRSQNSLSRQDSFDQGNAGNGNVRKDCILHVQEKNSQIDIANDENISKAASQLTINDTKPFVSNLSPNSQNFVPKKYVKTAQTEPSTAQVYESNQVVLTKSHVYPVPVPANLVMERDMHSLRDVENSMRSSRQNQEFARSYVSSQSSGRDYNTNDSAEKSNGSQTQQSKNEHSNVESLQSNCETTLAPNSYQKTNLVETDVNVTSNISMKVNYQHYAVQNNFTEETAVHSGSTKEYATKNARGSSRYENGTHETQPDSQLSKAISNVNANNEELNTNEVSSTENNTIQTQSERVILSQSAIYARPVDTSTGQGVLNVSNHEIELNSIYDRNYTCNNERNSANSITGLNYPGFNDNGGAERSFQPRSSANHGFARRDGGFRFRFNSRNAGFRAPSHGAVQQLHQQMQLQYGRPFMFARQMYTGGWSRRSPSPLSSTFQSVHQNGPRYSGPRPVRPPQYQDRYNARR